MKKALTLFLVLSILFVVTGCTSTPASTSSEISPSVPATPASSDATSSAPPTPVAKEDLRIGVIHIMELGDQGYTYNHDQGVKKMLAELGLSEDQYIPKFNINDTDVAATNAAIAELVDAGCQMIFATSFSYGTQVTEAAKQYPEVIFLHATGTEAHTAGLPNYHNYFAKIHQARYLAGIAAGLKTEADKLGYVAAYPYAEVISGYTAFFLGARSVNPDVTMDVIYIDSWGDPQREREVAEALADRGCDVISQHSDSVTPALGAQDKGVFHVGYNNDMAPAAPSASIISARIDWGIYMTEAVRNYLDGKPIPVDWSGDLASGAVYLSSLNEAVAAPGTQAALDAAAEEIRNGMKIFKGALKAADGSPAVITDFGGNPIFTFEDENSVFEESPMDGFSAPAYNAIIDGINIIS